MQLHVDFSLLFLNAFFIFGIWYCFQPGNVFNPEKIRRYIFCYETDGEVTKEIYDSKRFPIGKLLNKVLGHWWSRPVFTCPMCMSSLWGSAFYLTFADHKDVQSWFVHVIALAGLNSLLKSFQT